MHCFPVRRNVIVTDEVLIAKTQLLLSRLIIEPSAQLVLQKILEMSNKTIINSGQNW
jgi:hypothetical protein